ncbi:MULTISPECIES: PTS transporter subunit EIIC [unclassified Shewanella]|uniref:PTS transporter subunit EIIC n=1 Tax=unclassified Shewanella TaxID=196818 RepID=UPI000C85D5E9|nr:MULTISPECIES: PTS transporter subunit EIIC [unclassified Shewanella]MDO6678370.1 PTS transporter subunit EIIC [Shewanella sp. 4_MG-2023]PMG42209.1 PTS glucose transporter subunit IIBC [Shewanella sp. 10N.286.52.B9]PMH96946.1 PTS glucose transporter subunit IIBC [Shewanella sp. 10N.286.48.A6]
MDNNLANRSNPVARQLRLLSQRWFKFAQRLSQALLIPIAILPAAGVMLGLSANPLPFISTELAIVLSNVGNLIFTMMPLLFAIAIAIGFCQDQGIAAFVAVFGFGVYISSLGAMTTLYHLPSRPIWGMETMDTGIAGGVLIGALTCLVVRLSENVKLPAVFSFFEGHRSAALIIIPFSMLMAFILAHIWPTLAYEIDSLSLWAVYQEPAVAFGVYGAIERLLIPLGLHHIWNAPFYLEVGQYIDDGKLVRGEIARYLAGDPAAGNFAGGYLIKMWGLPAAALAIWRSADKSERNRVAGIMLSAATASWLTGITEPIEFAFMFVAPILFLIHAILTGVAYSVCVLLEVKHSVVFSHGLIDFSLLFAQSSNTQWIWFLGPLTGFVYYLLFRVSIVAFNLKTPGRLEADGHGNKESLRSMISALGGADNIVELNACLTRLRITVVNPKLVDKPRLMRLGAKGVIKVGHGVQVVFGTKAESLRKLLQKYLDTRK